MLVIDRMPAAAATHIRLPQRPRTYAGRRRGERTRAGIGGWSSSAAYLGEAIEKGLGEALPSTALLQGVLAAKDAEASGAREGLPEIRNVDGRAMVEARVEALQDALRREIELVQDDPVPGLEGREEGAVLPRIRARGRALHG